ncbi:hypothetical protein E1B28_001255 [Marasmius oreades]|uniref:Uncharacterized protein n=1 Tax=Marasmius oreades TaxID=181124 RepID=A0A9P8AF75_9AGAR|nr:uncharacterized protein E1B28_001255 [Marasmius oreades]KAG7099402.1 hypothetical protein E1B28_001255 [Marasmius oreades]
MNEDTENPSTVVRSTQNEIPSLPVIVPTLRQLDMLSQDDLELVHTSNVLRPSQLSGQRPMRVAFALLVLLAYRRERLRDQRFSDSPWDRWFQETEAKRGLVVIEKNIQLLWEEFLSSYCNPKDVEGALWTEFPLEEGCSQRIRVVDHLAEADPPIYLLTHQVVQYSLLNYWRKGPVVDPSTARHYLTTKYDSLCTPRLSHAVDLGSRMIFFALLASYTLDPPRKPSIYIASLEYIHAREIFLMLFAVSIPWLYLGIPFALTTLAFLSSLPSVPFPGDIAFNILLISLFSQLFLFHLPVPPCPIFIFSLQDTLPFVLLLFWRVSHVIVRLFLFFLPALILSLYLLSFSMADTFLRIQITSWLVDPSPMETRGGYLVLLFLVMAMICICFFVVVPVSSPLISSPSWDVYSKDIGVAARTAFVHALIRYSYPYPFPPPFNTVRFLFLLIPSFVFQRLGVPPSLFDKLNRGLWRLIVGPVFLLIGVLMSKLP